VPEGPSSGLLIAVWMFPVVLLGSAALFRAGRLRYLGRNRWSQYMPLYARNHPFAFGPFGIAAIFLATALVAIQADERAKQVLLSIALPGMFAFLLLGLAWVWRPPEFLKPSWLHQEDLRHGGWPDFSNRLIDRVLIGILAVGFGIAFLVTILGSLALWFG
jgi:hypothetical protein